jgi:hypothetical protein
MVGRVWPRPQVDFNVGISSKNSNVGHSFLFRKTEKVFLSISHLTIQSIILASSVLARVARFVADGFIL